MSEYQYEQQAVIFQHLTAVSINASRGVTISEGGCGPLWDPVTARFSTCALPWINAISAIIAALILVIYVLRLLVPLQAKWPRPFVEEYEVPYKHMVANDRPHVQTSLIFLILYCLAGLGLSVAQIWHPCFRLLNVFPALSWAVATALVMVLRPRTTPKSVLILLVCLFMTRAIVVADTRPMPKTTLILSALELVLNLGAILVILNMPMRDPRLPVDDISPAFSQPTFELRSPEDNITLWQFMSISWMTPLIAIGSKRQLHDEDVWKLAYEFQHKQLYENFRQLRGSVLGRLIKANWIDLVILGSIGVIDTVAFLSIPVFLQRLLASMENPLAPERAAIAYALLILVASVISSQVQVSGLWYGRRTYERSRGEMIAMLYEKTLARKIVTSSKSSAQESEANPISELETAPKKGIQRVWERCWNGVCIVFPFLRSTSTGTQKTKTEEPASMGKILNLMRNDVYEISQRFWEFQGLVEKPLGLVLSIVLIWRLIGWPCLIGIVTVFIAQSLNALLAKVLMKWEVTKRAATDAKLKKVSQFVESIRHLRWYGWQDAWCTDIMDARQEELHLQIICSIWRILIEFTNIFASGMFPVAAFWAYSGLAGMPLRIDIAFPALQLFRKLEESLKEIPSLITVMLNARVAMGRIESFMAEPDISENETSDNSTNRQAGSAGLLNNSNGNRTTDDESRSITNDDGRIEADQADNVVEKLELKHASFSWPAGPPVLHDVTISFPPGLTIVFGEVAAGKSALLQALLGELDRNAGELHRPTGMVGYCAQTPWLQSMSIRENILFGAPYDNQRYKAVIEACALANDLVNFKHGDLSNIGENGIGLSGGQRARVALARAVYSQAEILLLDDPISALDHQTAEFIIQRCLGGNLVKSRTVVLVTHRVELCRHIATQAVEVDHGKAYVVDFAKAIAIHGHDGSSSEEDEEAQESEEQDKTDAAVPEKFIDEEHRASGGVQARVYWEYIKAGKIKFWFILVILLASFRLVSIGETWFLKQWGEAYDTLKIEVKSHGPFSDLPPPEENINPWLLGFTLIAIAKAVTFLIASAFMLVIVYSAGKSMFEKVMARVSHATFRFYDTTPVGRLMNRLTSDITTIDGNISETFQTVAAGAISWISGLIVIASVTPAFLVFSIIVTLAFAFTFRRFLPSSQSLRRLEMVSLSPLMSNFGALVEGLMTVRAFHAQHRFQERVIEVVDNFQKMDHYYWSLQSWFMYRINLIADFAMLIITLIAIYTNVSPGLTAFVLIAAQSLVGATFGLCRSYGKLQMDFVSVERVYEMMILDQEPLGSVDPPAWWPTLTGDIIFDKATLRYAPHLDPSLSDLSFRIKAGSNTAIVGRTGSGKSTLAMALLGTVLPDSGRILIDNIDIASVEKQALRHRVTFVAQDPVLFPGSMRQNLDPLDEYTDEECEAVLKKIAGKHGWTLTTEVDAGGKNLSQGQRQLIGLARTLLRRSPIVILDEATASIDLATSLAIQEVLHSEMRESTIITIAHRLEAVKYADYCIELGKGKLLRMGTRDEILGNVG